MNALSIRQPWASLIVEGIKDIENRTWTTAYRGPLLIHASTRFDESASLEAGKAYLQGGLIGMATLVDIVKESESAWFVGPYGWVLRDARPLPFVPLRGKQWLFRVDEQVLKVIFPVASTRVPATSEGSEPR